MSRTFGFMVLSVVLGAAAMYGVSNFKVRVEPVAAEVPATRPSPFAEAAPLPLPPEPARLPEAVFSRDRPTMAAPLGAVRPASASAIQPPGDAAAAAGPKFQLLKLTEQPFADAAKKVTWAVDSQPRLFSRRPTTHFVGALTAAGPKANPPIKGWEVTVNGSKRATDYTTWLVEPTATTVTLNFDHPDLKEVFGPVDVTVTGTDEANTAVNVTTRVYVPRSPASGAVAVSQQRTSPYVELASVPTSGAKLYGPFVELTGTFTGVVSKYEIVAVAADGTVSAVGTAVQAQPAPTFWNLIGTVGAPLLTQTNADLVLAVRAHLGDGDHLYAMPAQPYRMDAVLPPLPAPAVAVATDEAGKSVSAPADTAVAGVKMYRTNTRKLKVTVTPTVDHAQAVLLYVDGQTPKYKLPAKAGEPVVFPLVEVGAGQDHVIRAAVARGDVPGTPAVVDVKVVTVEPAVESVLAPGFGAGAAADKIVIKFTTGSKLTDAANKPANYKVEHIEAGKDVAPAVATAVYDSIADTVTLTVTGVKPGSYKLRILKAAAAAGDAAAVPGISDMYGNPLQTAADAEPGNHYQTTLYTQQLAAALPSVVATGLSLQTAPAVPLPEYVKFRTSPDGFNPSDRVETRVVRLYYYRDAGRVAQLVNRTVKAYNATRVDVRRLAADRARDDADATTDERKRLEGVAVRAAQDARAAEAELRNLQQNATTARTEAATARTAISQKQIELDQARRDLAAAQAQVDARAATDPAVLAQQQLQRTLQENRLQISNVLATNPNEPDRQRQRENDARIQTEELNLTRIQQEAKARAAAGVDPFQNRVLELQRQVAQFTTVAGSAEAADRNTTSALIAAQNKVADLREKEARTLESWQVKELQERRGRENEFRRDVAAANENLDIAAAAQPLSEDPVLQTSIAVIGEGLIQLRGPIKGLNVIRIMINQIDAPVGQVRIGVHTLQVNGERVDRMERVVANIQRHIDHSRFLTVQSGEYLRKAVVLVASRKAEQAAAELGPNCDQAARDYKYLYAFFGKDFTDELYLLDSEFLKTGNKLLSLHSMNTTSLASALFVMALAKNDVRAEIVAEFQRMMQCELPQAETNYYLAGLVPANSKCEAHCDKKFYMLAYNARFQSFLGFFNAEVNGTDTLNPLQREFLRLAQIFKARMITEIQLKQRVMERSLLEDRVGNYLKELNDAKQKEDAAKNQLATFQDALQDAIAKVTGEMGAVQVLVDDIQDELLTIDHTLTQLVERANTGGGAVAYTFKGVRSEVAGFAATPNVPDPPLDLNDPKNARFREAIAALYRAMNQFVYDDRDAAALKTLKDLTDRITAPANRYLFLTDAKTIIATTKPLLAHVRAASLAARSDAAAILAQLQGREPNPTRAAAMFVLFRDGFTAKLNPSEGTFQQARAIAARANPAVVSLQTAQANYEAAERKAKAARRPLDEKKLLDMLVDEMEDKFIELLEGTRAHTANVDNYMKNVATALDDDFNTQFYLPSFRRAREASTRYWDVTLAQIETTNVLANNRAFAKVSPAASFEFDLPKRSILLKEGFASAKALMDEYGALMTDPSFLALAKISSGNPVSMMSGGGGGLSAVRNVLPGLPSSADEMILAQAGGGKGREVGSALEALIPDPAIYKIETGTGFEIRPVLSPDGQAVVFNFNYMYTTDVREPVRADEKHLGRVKRHFVNTDVQLGNYELREVSKYQVAAKLARTAKGVPLLQDIPGLGLLFRPLPSAGSSLQQNLIYAQSTIFPTLFDLMGLRYAQAVADLDPMADRMAEFAARARRLDVEQRIYDITAARVDEATRTPFGERRPDTYRPQISIPYQHPNGYYGPALRQRDGTLQEMYDPTRAFPPTRYAEGTTPEGRQRPLPNPTLPPGGAGVPEMYNGSIPLGGNDQSRRVPTPGYAVPPTRGNAGPGGYPLPPNVAVREIPATPYQATVTPGGVPAMPVSRPTTAQPLGTPRPAPVGVPSLTPPPAMGTLPTGPR